MREKQTSLWTPNEEIVKKSNLVNFVKYLNKKNLFKYSENFKNLWKWSINNPELFWSEIWNFTKIKGIKGKKIIKKNKIFYKNIFFPDSKLNYTENLLCKKNDETALYFFSETGIEKKTNWKELYNNVCKNYPIWQEEANFDLKKYCMETLNYSKYIDRFNGSIDTLLIP